MRHSNVDNYACYYFGNNGFTLAILFILATMLGNFFNWSFSIFWQFRRYERRFNCDEISTWSKPSRYIMAHLRSNQSGRWLQWHLIRFVSLALLDQTSFPNCMGSNRWNSCSCRRNYWRSYFSISFACRFDLHQFIMVSESVATVVLVIVPYRVA